MLLEDMGIKRVVFLDFETTGLDYKENRPIEVAVRDTRGEVNYSTLIKLPEGQELSEFIVNYTGITDKELLEEGKDIEDVKKELKRIITDSTMVVAHNANFDLAYLKEHFGIVPKYFFCTRAAWYLEEPDKSSSLQNIVKRHLGDIKQEHRAMGDVQLLGSIYKILEVKYGRGISFFVNKMVETPNRELMYVPSNAEVLNFNPDKKIKEVM